MLTTRLWSGVLISAVVVACSAVPASVAWANSPGFDESFSCSGVTCEVVVRSSGSVPAVTGATTSPQSHQGGHGEGRATATSCELPDVEFSQSGMEGPVQMPLGQARCSTSASSASQGPDAQVVIDPAVLAEQARASMTLPLPGIGTAPPLGKPRFVNMPSWMWIDADGWEPVSATASVGAGSVTVVASPERVVWETGDGQQVVCEGSGTVYSPAVFREEGSPDCGHTYTSLPPGGAGAEVDLVAVWEWSVSWSTSTGGGGELEGLSTSATEPVAVSEIHSVVTHTR